MASAKPILLKFFKPQLSLLINCFFLLLVSLVTLVLFNLHDNPLLSYSYLLFPLMICLSRFHSNKPIKDISGVLALLLVIVLGLIFPADVEEIEEAFILIPILYIIISPHSLWPIAAAFSLLLTYFPSMAHHELIDIFEDSLELVVITSFATIMSFYQNKTQQQSLYFKQQSLTDELTQIPNRKAFNNQLFKFLGRGKSNDKFYFAIMLLDLDNFKRINDQFGHNTGDHLLTEVASRLSKIIAHSSNCSTIYRIGGDEFSILVTKTNFQELKQHLLMLIDQIYCEQNCRYHLQLSEQIITPTIGISIYPQDGDKANHLFRNVDLAMYHSKKQGKKSYAFFEPHMHEDAIKRYELEESLRSAINKGELSLVYQPKICLVSGRIKGLEALIRWNSEKHGNVSPAEFIPIAETSGDIIQIGNWVVEQACKQLMLWQDTHPHLYLSINISAIQVAQPNFIPTITQIIKQSGVEPNRLEFELTETAIMNSPDLFIEKFNAIKKQGISIAIDDFGIAYSSLSYLTRLPIDTLKIDKSFVDHCTKQHQDKMVVRTIVQLSQNLGLATVAEGVECEQQKILLQQEGVDQYQGYLHSKPMNVEEINKLLSK